MWIRNFAAAVLVLLVLKLLLIGNNVFGTEAFGKWYSLALKTFLLIGNDVLGAGLLATLIALVALPWVLLDRPRGVALTSVILQGLHAVLAVTSFFTTILVGGPLNKAMIDLGLLGSADAGAGAGAGPALWSSVRHYLDLSTVLLFVGAIGVGVASYALYPRLAARVGRRAARVIGGFLAVELLVTVLLLPWLINGHLAGIRVHTYGLEQSAGTALAWSYAKPLLQPRPDPSRIADEFRFDLRASAPAAVRSNPLRRATPRRTSVILISLESVGGPYLERADRPMPYLRGASASGRGVYLADHYAVWPQTMKAFFSVFCSELPYPHYQPITLINPAIPCRSLSEVLHDNGYRTALITSADLAYDRKRRFFNHRAFDSFVDMRNMPGRETVWGDSWGLDERIAVRNILDLARERGDQPYFVFYEMFTAHHPYNACQEHVDNPLGDDIAQYLRALGYIDDRIVELIDGLAALGQLDDTLIAVFADHGEGFGQHPGSKAHGPKVYQETIQVPAAFFGPQLQGVEGDVELTTSHVDLAPTILGLIGIEPPCTMKGRDLSSTSEPRIALFGGRPPGGQRGLVDGNLKYIDEEDGPEYVFDLAVDPGERRNVLKQHTAAADGYRKRLDDWVVFSENLVERYAEILDRSGCRP